MVKESNWTNPPTKATQKQLLEQESGLPEDLINVYHHVIKAAAYYGFTYLPESHIGPTINIISFKDVYAEDGTTVLTAAAENREEILSSYKKLKQAIATITQPYPYISVTEDPKTFQIDIIQEKN